jgi:hypothetical protein
MKTYANIHKEIPQNPLSGDGLTKVLSITLFRSITSVYGIDSVMWNILHIQTECGGIFCKKLPIPQNNVLDLNNVMKLLLLLFVKS